jgi:hypothetical protein
MAVANVQSGRQYRVAFTPVLLAQKPQLLQLLVLT